MSSQSIQQKQQYLRQNVIDAGYDAELFVQYCTNSHGLQDLADWSMNKIIQIVKLYIHQKNQTQIKYPQIKTQKDDQQQWSNYEESIITKQQKINDKNNHKNSQPNFKEEPHNTTKTGHLIFSQADWDMFLGGLSTSTNTQSIVNTLPIIQNQNIQIVNPINKLKSKQDKKQHNNSTKVQNETVKIPQKKETSIKVSKNQEGKIDNLGKDNPLSPPSKDLKQQQNLMSMNLSGISSGNAQNRGPINYTNIRIQTCKPKALLKIPHISSITITKTQQISRNFLQSDYTLYHIHFSPGTHTIQRKFSDFRKLRSILQNIYPHIRLPYLQPQGWLTSSQGKDTQTLAKYKWMIQDFLMYLIVRNQELKNCLLVRRFCGFSTALKSNSQYQDISKQDLRKIFETQEALPKVKNIGELMLTNNSILLPPSQCGQKYLTNTINVMQQIDYQYEKLKKKFQNLFYNYDLLAKSMTDVTSSFEVLQNLIKKYNFQNNESKQFRVYQGIKEMCTKMQDQMNQQYVIFKSRIKNMFRYQKDNMMTLKQLFQPRNKIHLQYTRQGSPTLSKSAQSSKGQLQVQSSISIQQPYKANKNNLCIQQIFWSHFVKTSIQEYWEELRRKINQQLTMISYEELDNENDNLNFWNSMIKKSVV